MKLLFDHNLPPALVARLSDLFPHSEHVFPPGLDRASDFEIREYAGREALVIITKDADFSEMCAERISPEDYLDTPRKLFYKGIGAAVAGNVIARSKRWKLIQ